METTAAHSEFIEKLQASIENDRFVKLTLSKPGGADKSLKNVYARLVEIKDQPMLSFTLRYPAKDVTKNFSIAEGITMIAMWLGDAFLNGDLFTTEADISIQYSKKRKPRIFAKSASQKAPVPKTHDKPKKRFIQSAGNRYLREMGITGADEQVLAAGQRKFRQINKYIEIIDVLLQQVSLPDDPHIVDMGSGKGYLTFALYDHLQNNLKLKPRITGIELRQHLVDFCNELSEKTGFANLRFIAQDINAYQPERIDMLIALHACDIATDLAIAKGIKANAKIIVVAPCCHKQVRKEMRGSKAMQSVLQHGILEERQAELLTDGIRALLMEAHGYRTKVFEFISTEHTSKNLMITGIKGEPKPAALEEVAAIKAQFGIGYHYLEKLLA